MVLTLPVGSSKWQALTLCNVDFTNSLQLEFQPRWLASSMTTVLDMMETVVSSLAFVRSSTTLSKVHLPSLGLTLPRVYPGYSFALFPGASIAEVDRLLSSMGSSISLSSLGSMPLTAPLANKVFRLSLDLDLPGDGLAVGDALVEELDVYMSIDTSAVSPSFSFGFGFHPISFRTGTNYTLDADTDLSATFTAEAVTIAFDLNLNGDPWVNPWGLSDKVEVVWPAEIQFGASFTEVPPFIAPTLFGFSGVFQSPADERYNTNMVRVA